MGFHNARNGLRAANGPEELLENCILAHLGPSVVPKHLSYKGFWDVCGMKTAEIGIRKGGNPKNKYFGTLRGPGLLMGNLGLHQF